ncbi:MAG: glycosyltransferase [Patescibacteria group bacterium]|nr:glycosyltransferase [Patescibacteria group bacterium]
MNYAKVAVIIPTYNERQNILWLIEQLMAVMPGAKIVIVDDNSPDQTALVIKSKYGKSKTVFLLVGIKKQGRGAAVLRGFNFAYHQLSSQIMVEMDADHSHQPQLLPQMISLVNQQTVVSASRYLPGSSITGWSKLRVVFSHLANWAVKIFLSSPLTDSTNGFRAYPRSAIQVLITTRLLTANYVMLAETTALLTGRGFEYREVVSHFPNRRVGQSNTNLRLAFQSLADLSKIWFRYRLEKSNT